METLLVNSLLVSLVILPVKCLSDDWKYYIQLMILGSFVLKLHVIEPIAKLLVMAPFPGIEKNHVQEY